MVTKRFQGKTTLAVFSCAIFLMGAEHAASGLILGRSGGGGRVPVLTTAATTSWAARSQISRGDSAEVGEGSTKPAGKFPFHCKFHERSS